MLLSRGLRQAKPHPGAFSFHPVCWRRRLSDDTTRPSDPLRVLFCGADEFSNYSLWALHKLKSEKPDILASIDVVCRSDKRVGRGLKWVNQVPIKPVAQSLDLPIHQLDTFTGWSPPSPIDLVVAVSFGLLVPSRILNGATYGGLNVHPSLLPQLRGASPLQTALLEGWSKTGISLQTMHPSKFDQGTIIAQPPEVSIPDGATVEDLIKLLGPIGADMLIRGIENGLYRNPKPVVENDASQAGIVYAPKLTKEDAHINWNSSRWSSADVIRRGRILDLWDDITYQACGFEEVKRVIFHGPWKRVETRAVSDPQSHGKLMLYRQGGKQWHIAFLASDGIMVAPTFASIEGKPKRKGLEALSHALRSILKNGPPVSGE